MEMVALMIFSEEQGRMVNLEDMKVSDLRELARARRMRGLLQVKEGRAD
jgi:hypothetical protein